MDYYSVPRRILRGARQLVYPRRCPFCDRVLGSVPVCPDCAAELEELRRKPGMRLDASQHYLGELTGAAAPFRYEGCVRRGILHTKYHAAPWAAVELGLWLAKLAFGSEMHMAGAEPVPELVEGMSLGYDCIVPVPASGRARGYNVPQLMAVPLARALGIPLYPKALGRTRAKRHQAGLPFEQRLANVAGAFRVPDTELVEGRKVLLVDDVIIGIDGKKVHNFADLQEALAKHRPGDKVKVKLMRDKKEKTVEVTLKNEQGTTKIVKEAGMEILGAAFKELPDDLKKQLNLGYGLQVTGVSSGKMSDAGVRKGFIILKANDQPMRKVSDLEEVMKAAVKSPNQVLFLTGVFPSGKRGYFAVDLTQE